MKEAFYHIELDNDSADLCTFITPFGRGLGWYRFLRLPFGIATAPEVFQKMAMVVFEGMEEVTVYFDDIIIATENEAEHKKILSQVVERDIKWGIKFIVEKMQFMTNSVRYVGIQFTEEGVLPDESLVEVVVKMREPNNSLEVQQALGLGSYLSEFIRNLASITGPLRQLIRKKSTWRWGNEE